MDGVLSAQALQGPRGVDDLLGLRFPSVGLRQLGRQFQGLVDRVIAPEQRGRIHLAQAVTEHRRESEDSSSVANPLLTLDGLERDYLGDVCVSDHLL